jgi:hypothetical protein
VYIEDMAFATHIGNSTLGVNAARFTNESGLSTGLSTNNVNDIQANDRINEFTSSFLVKTTDVSEPSIIGLFAAGFLGIGLARRRKTK